jgi:uncharacterized protein (DUF983 family)
LIRGVRKRCPRCGQGAIFDGWYTVRESCAACQFDFVAAQSETWAFMYISTAAMTGAIVLGMLLLHPGDLLLGRAVVLMMAIVLILLSLPYRKGLAMAIEFVIEERLVQAGRSNDTDGEGNPGHEGD